MATPASHTEGASQAEGHAHGHDDGEVHAHVAPWQLYVGVLVALLFLTFLTVSAARVNIDGFFGSPRANTLNLMAAILIAALKAGIVAAFFMHLRHDKLMHTIAFIAAFVFLSVFLFLTRDDLAYRHEIDPDYGSYVNGQTGERAPGGIHFTAPPGETSAEPAASGAPPPSPSAAPAPAPEKH
jgi:cytochrome c oxidase subunit 4